MEPKGERKVPIRLAAASRSRAGRRGNCTRAAHRRFSRQHGGTGPHLQAFGRQDCFTRNPTVTTTYPFPVSSNNFEGKRVLVTGGYEGNWGNHGMPLYSGRRSPVSECWFRRSKPLSGAGTSMQPLSSGLNAKSIGKVSLNVSAPPTPSGGSTHFYSFDWPWPFGPESNQQ